jgi:hypothetical protein
MSKLFPKLRSMMMPRIPKGGWAYNCKNETLVQVCDVPEFRDKEYCMKERNIYSCKRQAETGTYISRPALKGAVL